MNVYFLTFGCKVNLYETENMKRLFSEAGYGISDGENGAGVFVVNSCAVTEEGVKKLKKELRRLRRSYPEAVIALTGCFPQAFEEEARALAEADVVTGTKNRALLPKLVTDFISSGTRITDVCQYTRKESFEDMCNERYENNTRAFLKIQDGCGMFCSYCIIPYSRGNFRSKPIESVVSEACGYAAAGHREIVLTGINLSFYGVDFGKRLADAVEAVCGVGGIERVRLSSVEPEMLTESDIKRLSRQEKLCPHFHLSLQSGCDRTLKAMNRRYLSADYEKIVNSFRENFESCSVTTDIIVGFPGETEEDFGQSLEFAEKMGFAKAHIFPYSRRKGTPAAEMENQVPEEVKRRRAAEMSAAMEMSREKFLQSRVGTVSPVLFEREKEDGVHRGYTPDYTPVKILTKYSEKSLRNQIFYVKIVSAEKNFCVGEIIKKV